LRHFGRRIVGIPGVLIVHLVDPAIDHLRPALLEEGVVGRLAADIEAAADILVGIDPDLLALEGRLRDAMRRQLLEGRDLGRRAERQLLEARVGQQVLLAFRLVAQGIHWVGVGAGGQGKGEPHNGKKRRQRFHRDLPRLANPYAARQLRVAEATNQCKSPEDPPVLLTELRRVIRSAEASAKAEGAKGD
jgi:hypothetical protein